VRWFDSGRGHYINGKRLNDSSYSKPGRRDDRSGFGARRFWIVPKDSASRRSRTAGATDG